MSSHLVPINLRVPADVLAVLDEVCGARARTKYIVGAIRQRLAGDPAAQPAREALEEAIKEKAGSGEQLTRAEAAHWHHTRIEQAPTFDAPAGRLVMRGGELVALDTDGRTSHERRIAEARLRAESVGEELQWDEERIGTYIANRTSDDDGLLAKELGQMLEERKRDDA